MELKTKQDLINYLYSYYLNKSYIPEESRTVKIETFKDMFKKYEDAILISAFKEWMANYSSHLGTTKDFFDDLGRYKNICDRPLIKKQNEAIAKNETGVSTVNGKTIQRFLTEEIYTKHLRIYQEDGNKYKKGNNICKTPFECFILWANNEIDEAKPFLKNKEFKEPDKVKTEEARVRGDKLLGG